MIEGRVKKAITHINDNVIHVDFSRKAAVLKAA